MKRWVYLAVLAFSQHFKPNTGFDVFNGEHKAGPAVMSLLPFLHFSEPPPACLITRN